MRKTLFYNLWVPDLGPVGLSQYHKTECLDFVEVFLHIFVIFLMFYNFLAGEASYQSSFFQNVTSSVKSHNHNSIII